MPIPLQDVRITGFTVRDLRWPTSLDQIGSDPMNSAGENALGYLQYQTSAGITGTGWSFSNGQGNEVLVAAIKALAPRFVGRSLADVTANFGATHRNFVGGQTRFMSPERGVLQLATCAVLNAVWDAWAKAEGKPLWRLIADFSPEEFVRCIDFRYITDAITPEEAIALLKEAEKGKAERLEKALNNQAVQAYNTSIGWLGLSDEVVAERLHAALNEGFRHFKLKVGLGLDVDRRRLGMIRKIAGDKAVLMTDVNQLWDVDQAIEYMPKLADLGIYFIEEPTSPDDVLGHAKIREALQPYGIKVVTGEHINNRVMFKQFYQAEATDATQLDACRLSGVNEIMSVLLMSAKYKIPVIPHTGGAGMLELCQHLSTLDYVSVSGNESILEYVDHLHESFLSPATINKGFHITPTDPGYSCDVHESVFEKFECPSGSFWQSAKGLEMLNDPWRGCPSEQTS